jgi:5'-nucleotidase
MAIRAVVTNDDGIDSPGLRQLALAAIRAGCDVVVAAPHREASGTSASLSPVDGLTRVGLERRTLDGLDGVACYVVRALPAFITFTAIRGGFGAPPDLVLSGINRGPNAGHAVLHSGTVGAAMTAATYGVRAAAFSLDLPAAGQGEPEWELAGGVAAEVIGTLDVLPAGLALNVNVPDIRPAGLRGIRLARLAEFGVVQLAIASAAEDYLEFTVREDERQPEPGTDTALLAAGFATVTALRPVCETQVPALPWAPGETEPASREAGPKARYGTS